MRICYVIRLQWSGNVLLHLQDDSSGARTRTPWWRLLGIGLLRTLPLWLTVLLLILTRIEPIGIREPIKREDPHFTIHLGNLLQFRLSAWLVASVRDIFGESDDTLTWSYEILYVPFVIPFIVASVVTVAIWRRQLAPGTSVLHPFREAAHRCAMAQWRCAPCEREALAARSVQCAVLS